MLTHAVSNDLESVAGAQARLLDQVGVLAPETVGLDAALGRILAEPVSSRADLPGFDNSAMDGYAVRAADIAQASTEPRCASRSSVNPEPVRCPTRSSREPRCGS